MSKASKQRRNEKRKAQRLAKKNNNHQRVPQPNIRPAPFDRSQLRYSWSFSRNLGPGLVNAFNTCFLNAVLCCLTYTAPLTQYLLTDNHKKNCTIHGFCGLCAMSEHVNKCFTTAKSLMRFSAISPNYFTSNLKKISSNLLLGRQEDAHEFFMFLLDAFTKSYTPLNSKLTPQEEDAGLVHTIFGGKLQSQVTCNNCKANSNSYDRFLDLSVQINGEKSIQNALSRFIEADTIDGYNCDTCKQKVRAYKQMTANEVPHNLVIHLKRFEYDMYSNGMRKIHKSVKFPETLDMAPYISKEKKVQAAEYKLYAVLVHAGSSCDAGHYFAYVKNPQGGWLLINDETVHPVSINEVLSQRAYMLFYEQSSFITKSSNNCKPKQDNEIKRPLDFKLPEPAHAKKCLKREHEKEDEEEVVPVTAKKVKFDEMEYAIATEPEAWVVRPAGMPYRSLLGNQSPRTYSNAMGHISQWTIGTV
ncbi:hypothetical protein G6F55_006849 [Rhizopus delemar]|uniref:ubiquitinyl hydrolase 1 n=2 Tax=Rhizopus TaxID=4842 RepID=A0A9P7CLY7_9FUNG|nr:hypothetical protein G6F55_006849 [Rhizopus delemar]KAG1523102.1 hypothetical protein G6F52_005297 [Rhizopus delemar]KAG1539475.1 hypothetical protein G6F51_009120 [Rhizopus arrhizus]KAG1566796.1 hypothetical protein G6F50_008810 [Rhizopus delemar]KAG1630026.1 hypothetical protein G6F45_005803 [Rhizopus arrhizus]